jgi:hypothetical protein
MSNIDKAAEALRLADKLAALVDTYPQEDEDTPGGYCSVFDEQLDTAASWLREYAALLQAQPVACLVENEALRKDAQRLDAIERNARCDPKMCGNHVWWPTTWKHQLTGPTLRAAIDAAMTKGEA